MRVFIFIIIFILLIKPNNSNKLVDIDYSFPDGFLIGVATSSYQVEGAWNESGKSENIWDHFSHTYPDQIADSSNGDIACDFYHKYQEDIKILKDIGVNHFRFSISWSRILPTGYTNNVNEEGVRYYHSILDELEKYEIQPMITIYHWDHPQSLEDDFGGWLNETMVDLYADYATFVIREFGHRVKYFTTINEPNMYCTLAYSQYPFPPGLNFSNWEKYKCMHNMIKAHAKAYHIYDEQFRSQQNGHIGIVIVGEQYYSKNKSDLKSGNLAFEFNSGWVANPIFSKHGDYPKVMKKMIAKKSKHEGRTQSRLPTFSKEWIDYIKGSSDYFGLNHYSSELVEPLPKTAPVNVSNDEGLLYSVDEKWPSMQSSWLKNVPAGMGDVLRKIKVKYDNPPVYIMENGASDGHGVDDINRMKYIYGYMKEMLIAMKRDNCNVKAYTYWSFSDSFEWAGGYVDRFGLISIDFKDPNRTRTPKKSYPWFKSVCTSRKLQPI